MYAVEIVVDETVQKIANIKTNYLAGGSFIAHDVDRAIITEQMVELWPIGEPVDSI
jgi:hypothetical protein